MGSSDWGQFLADLNAVKCDNLIKTLALIILSKNVHYLRCLIIFTVILEFMALCCIGNEVVKLDIILQ